MNDERVMAEESTAFAARLDAVRQRIQTACERVGRPSEQVEIIAVTKGFGPETVRMAYEAGLTRMGENRVQEALAKAEMCPAGIEWHLIGHLQRNKVARALHRFSVFHSVDSPRLAEAMAAEADRWGCRVDILLEVNVSGESAKFGLAPEAVPPMIETVLDSSRLNLAGFMTLAPFETDPERTRPVFARLRELRDRWARDFGTGFDVLSMGMSNDFAVAVEEGATWIRLGTVLFGTRRGQGMRAKLEADETTTD